MKIAQNPILNVNMDYVADMPSQLTLRVKLKEEEPMYAIKKMLPNGEIPMTIHKTMFLLVNCLLLEQSFLPLQFSL